MTLQCTAFAGSIEGTAKYNGPVPNPKLLRMEADPICYTINKGNVRQSSLVLGENGALGNVFVYVKSGLSPKDYPLPQPAVMTQAGCNYSPHVLGVLAGQKVKFLNPDGTLHNVHIAGKLNPEQNLAMPEFRKELEVVFKKPEFMLAVRCDVHPWMLAYIAVMEHPFFAVTGADGWFEIKGLPAGTYTIEAWHEKLGSRTAVVTVGENGAQKSDFAFAPLE